MILSATFSKPTSLIHEKLGKNYEKIKLKIENSSGKTGYFVEMFTKTQVFHQHFSCEQIDSFINENIGITFKNCVYKTEDKIITLISNKKGKITKLQQPISNEKKNLDFLNERKKSLNSSKKIKNYLLPENKPIPFLQVLGIMNSQGKIISSKYDKFKQINRFLEFINDILPEIQKKEDKIIRIVDFGCGKSYLTFAVHYFLTEIKSLKCEIEGIDLKQDVIDYCNSLVKQLNLQGLVFHTGNICDYKSKQNLDVVITLHACDMATDFALKYAVEKNAKVILSVPCCQHQINQQIPNLSEFENSVFEPLLKWGIIKEKFSSLVTDAIRGEWLENQGYKVQMLEFIDIEHTPKNILIRAVKKQNIKNTEKSMRKLINELKINPEIVK